MIEIGPGPDSGTPHTLLDVRATTGEYIAANIEAVPLVNPWSSAMRLGQRRAARGETPQIGDELGMDTLPTDVPRPTPPEVPMLSAAEANERFGNLGLKFDAPVAAREAELLAETKRLEISTAAVFRAARQPTAGTTEGLGVGRSLLSVGVDLVGTAIDPLNVAASILPFVGPASRAGLAARFGRVGGPAVAGMIEGAAGNLLLEPAMAGLTLAEQREYGPADSLVNVLFGGVLGGGIGALRGFLGRPLAQAGESAPPLPPAVRDIEGAFRDVARELGRAGEMEPWRGFAGTTFDPDAPLVRALNELDPATRRQASEVAFRQLLDGRAIDIEPILETDPGWRSPASDGLEKLRQLIDARRVLLALPAPDNSPVALRGSVADQAPSSRFADVPVDQIYVDAKLFQFKSGGDTVGVTERLQGVTQWDERLAGLAIVWEDAGGRRWIVDGHQRLALAMRTGAKTLHAVLLKELNGETAAFARALAAFKNIAEGTGSAIDGAKILRETARDPAMAAALDTGRLPPLPPNSALVRDAAALARLSDDAFGLVVAGRVPPNHAAHVARILADPLQQTGAMETLARLKPDTAEQARLVVEQIRSAGFREGTQVDLFGGRDVAESLLLERARVLEATARALRKDAAVFRTLVDREAIASEAGNVLARDANIERLTGDKAALAVLEALGNRAGPIADALNAAARALGDGKRIGKVVDDFLKAVRAEAAAYGRPAARGAGEDAQDLMSFADGQRTRADDTIGAPREMAAQDAELRAAAEGGDLFALARAEQAELTAAAQEALRHAPELKAELEIADRMAKDAEALGNAANGLAECRISGGGT